MSANGTKRTSGASASRLLWGDKRTSHRRPDLVENDPKRTLPSLEPDGPGREIYTND
jgi:hypothetical protein